VKGCIRVRSDSLLFLELEGTMSQPTQASTDDAADKTEAMRIAVVSSCWHKPIVDQAVQAIRKHLADNGIADGDLDCFEVPGAFELPLHAKALAQTGRYDAIIACGLVVDGGIYRHEFVASAVIDGLMQVQLLSDIPVFSAVLTPHNFQEQEEHINFFTRHFVLKGTEVAHTCLETVRSLSSIVRH